MIALTQEQREELIESCKKEITHTEKLLSTNSLAVGWRKVHEKILLKNKITLASLTAEPVAYTSEFALVDVYIGDTAMMGKWNEVGKIPLFTAPPVPEIKLPEEFGEKVDDYFDSGKELGWNRCLEEIKRLNGLGE